MIVFQLSSFISRNITAPGSTPRSAGYRRCWPAAGFHQRSWTAWLCLFPAGTQNLFELVHADGPPAGVLFLGHLTQGEGRGKGERRGTDVVRFQKFVPGLPVGQGMYHREIEGHELAKIALQGDFPGACRNRRRTCSAFMPQTCSSLAMRPRVSVRR